MTLIWIVIVVFILWWFMKKQDSGFSVEKKEFSLPAIGEEMIFKAQDKFEEKIQENYRPDSISHGELYIYGKLMRIWYSELAGKNRYDDPMIQKLRRDWLAYMEALQDRATSAYLCMENEENDDFRENQITASRKAAAIEDAFSAAIGKDAINELARIREKDFFSFSANGELAPDGHRYSLLGELRKDQKDSLFKIEEVSTNKSEE